MDLGADADQLQQDGRDYIEAQAGPGYTLDRLVDWILGAVARMAVEVLILAGQVPMEIFKTFGQKVLRIAPLQDTVASSTVTFTVDALARTIPAGAQLSIDGVGFETAVDLNIAALALTGQVAVYAIIPGEGGSGLVGTSVELESPTYTWVAGVTLDAMTTGGQTGETGSEYADRLADELPTLSPKAILIEDVEAIARLDSEVARCLAIDNLVPPATTGVAGAVTYALQDVTGEPVSAASKARVTAAVETGRILNIDGYPIDGTYTSVDVTFVATCHADFDPAAVEIAAEQAISDFLDPSQWGRPDDGDLDIWVDEPTLRRNDLMGALYRVPGLRHVTTLTLALAAGVLGTADVALAGPAALPRAGTIAGTVTT